MKILDKYIASSVTLAFLSGVTMFVVLLCAMNLLKSLIVLIAQQGVPVGTAVTIIAYQIPGTLNYAFPMAMLLGILLTFSRMSSDSEMVAMRAAGISFVRIILPTLLIAVIITGLTFWISNNFVPYANKQSVVLTRQALLKVKQIDTVFLPVVGLNGKVKYIVTAAQLEVKGEVGVMRDVNIITYRNGVPSLFGYYPQAEWDPMKGKWIMHGGFENPVGLGPKEISMIAENDKATAELNSSSLITKNPFEFTEKQINPDNLTATELRARITKLRGEDDMNSQKEANRLATRLASRYATPFTCLVFALIGAPLGLRHHRTSSAVGLGISLIVIFIYYFVSVYLATFGDSGRLAPTLAAWLPVAMGAVLGTVLIVRANR